MARRAQKRGTTHAQLVEALDAGYRYWHNQMLRWMLSRGLEAFGLPAWEKAPSEAAAAVDEAFRTYLACVAGTDLGTDVLGSVYMELAGRWGKQALGQFFTPGHVARALSEMLLMGKPTTRSPGSLIRVLEPAAGSGVMLLSAMQGIAAHRGPSALLDYSFTGIDLDGTCARMTALQLLTNCNVHDMQIGEIVVLQGNALGDLKGLATIVRATPKPREQVLHDGQLRQRAPVLGEVEQLALGIGG
jgi:hypothetical protein